MSARSWGCFGLRSNVSMLTCLLVNMVNNWGCTAMKEKKANVLLLPLCCVCITKTGETDSLSLVLINVLIDPSLSGLMIIFIFFNVLVSTNLSQDEEVLKQIEREVQMRDGASKLLAACSRREQALEASKNLLTSNVRILALLSQLQQMKKNQILHRAGHRSDGAQG